MIRQVSLSDLGPVDFVPQAVVRSPVSYFSNRLGYKFEKEIDDLDEVESAFFEMDDGIPFALIHYRGNPADTTTIYFERKTPAIDVLKLVNGIITIFDLPPVSIVWVSGAV